METTTDEEREAKIVELEAAAASEIEYVSYGGEHHLPLIMNLVDQELSEPYSIFTYRYFVYLWPQLSFLAFHKGKCVGTVVCKMGEHRNTFRGYIAMLVVLKPYRGRGIGDYIYLLIYPISFSLLFFSFNLVCCQFLLENGIIATL
ncbi:unnamed protein product [Ilex paraguariensis]|uniref:N-acetyltransferase domain-containing protein n=1 Tax=Ilex paraguariensis TaxID=185542 RepID=A0ABC8TFW8_9AQUA